MSSQRPTDILNRSAFCALAGITPKAFESWLAAGCPVVAKPKSRGGDWAISPSQVFRWLWDTRKSGGSADSRQFEAQRVRLTQEQADHQALKNAALRGELLPAAEVVAGWQAAIARARALLLGIPIGAASTLVMLTAGREPQDAERAIREELIRLIDGALSELQNTKLDEAEDDGSQPADEGGAGAGGGSMDAAQARAAK